MVKATVIYKFSALSCQKAQLFFFTISESYKEEVKGML